MSNWQNGSMPELAAMSEDDEEPTPFYPLIRPGPFISGTTGQVLRLGQRVAAFEGESTKRGGGAGTTQGAAKKPKKSTATLADLVAWGLAAPGAILTVSYKGQRHEGTLTEDAQIMFQGKAYTNPITFTTAVRRQAGQPAGKHANDGWRAVQCEGVSLDELRSRYEAQRVEQEAAEAEQAAQGAYGSGVAAAVPATDQWVQCDRCDVWRVVPDSAWAQLAAEESESWQCSDATWNLASIAPFTPACII
mmetsp:Transcript_41/g.133  ORF Transcript_41/g.133 Transcript_41/m.133 type:complete len:248 (-) Transcript_41:578-1321(-)